MDARTKAYLLELNTDPRFIALSNEIRQGIPKILSFNPVSDNTEQWKHASGVREGYELCMSFLNMEINDE